jgi:hypothetical protein
MARHRCICRSFMSHRNCIEVSGAEKPTALASDHRGFFLLFGVCPVNCCEIKNPDAVNLDPLWN